MQVSGVDGLPNAQSIEAVALDLQTSNASSDGSFTLTATGTSMPSVPTLNYGADASDSTLAVVPLSETGALTVEDTGGVSDLSVTVEGYFTALDGSNPAAGGYVPIAPTTIFTTADVPLAAGASVSFAATGDGQPIPGGSAAAFLNVSTAADNGEGGLKIWPTQGTAPTVPSLRWSSGVNSSGTTVPLLADGQVTIKNTGNSSVDVNVSAEGYFVRGATANAGDYYLPFQDEIFTTTSDPDSLIQPGATQMVKIDGSSLDIPDTAYQDAAELNFSIFEAPQTGGSLSVWTAGSDPNASLPVAYNSGETTSDSMVFMPGVDGSIDVKNLGTTPIALQISVEGIFVNDNPGNEDNFGNDTDEYVEDPGSPLGDVPPGTPIYVSEQPDGGSGDSLPPTTWDIANCHPWGDYNNVVQRYFRPAVEKMPVGQAILRCGPTDRDDPGWGYEHITRYHVGHANEYDSDQLAADVGDYIWQDMADYAMYWSLEFPYRVTLEKSGNYCYSRQLYFGDGDGHTLGEFHAHTIIGSPDGHLTVTEYANNEQCHGKQVYHS